MSIPKYRTTGKIGERFFREILSKNKIPFIDLSSNLKFKEQVVVNCVDILGFKESFTYEKNIQRHPFDFIVNNKNIEIKTSKYVGGKVNFNLQKNDKTLIHYVIAFVLLEDKLWKIYLFDRETIQKYKGICFNPLTNSKYKEIKEKDIIDLLA